MELNPSHPVTRGLNDQWHRVAAILMHKHGIKKTVITQADLDAINKIPVEKMPTVIMHDRKDGLHLLMMPQDEALEYVALNNSMKEDRDEKPGNRN